MMFSQYQRFDCPHIVTLHNKIMEGTDKMDQNYNAYRMGFPGKKWWSSIFTREVDVSIQNSWILYRNVDRDISLLDFRRSVVQYYLRRYRNLPDHPHIRLPTKESSIDCGVPVFITLDGYMHFIQVTSGNQRRRFAGVWYSSRVRTDCNKCNLDLCIACFAPFHEQWNSHLFS